MNKKLTPGELVITISGVVLLIFSFFNWYGVSIGIGGTTLVSVGNNGWSAPSSFLSIIAILLGVAMAAFVIATKIGGVAVPEKVGNLGWGVVLLGAGGVAAVFLILKWIFNTDFTKFPLYISILAGIGLAVGGYLVANERGDLAAMKNKGGGAPPAA
ncbi:MAG: hypothetical protein WCI50_03405 [Actinomycetes bacterium]